MKIGGDCPTERFVNLEPKNPGFWSTHKKFQSNCFEGFWEFWNYAQSIFEIANSIQWKQFRPMPSASINWKENNTPKYRSNQPDWIFYDFKAFEMSIVGVKSSIILERSVGKIKTHSLFLKCLISRNIQLLTSSSVLRATCIFWMGGKHLNKLTKFTKPLPLFLLTAVSVVILMSSLPDRIYINILESRIPGIGVLNYASFVNFQILRL